jgi:hypothetical protein
VLAASIIRALMAARTFETLVKVSECQTTLRNKPEDSHLHPRRRENIKSQLSKKEKTFGRFLR